MGKFLGLKSQVDDVQMTWDLMRRHVDDVLQIMLHAHHLHVICTSSPWFQVIHMSSPWLTETGDDIRDHIWHQHIICMSCPWSLMWSPLTQVIQTLFSLSQMWSPLTEVILCYSHIHMHFVCASSLRSLGHLHIVPLVPRDWGWCWELHISLAYHLHVISVVSDVVRIDTDHPQAAFIVLDVVPIDRGDLQVVPVVPNAVPIDRGCCLHIISHLYGCLCGPWRLGMTLEITYVICMSSLWSPETWDYIRDHIGYYLCGPHVCMWSAHHLYTIYMSSLWSLETGHDIRHHIADDLYGPHVCTLSTHHFE